MAREIPPEIWIEVASFLPVETLRKLYAINHLFLELAMDARWREINVSTSEFNTSLSSFEPLLRLGDSYLANHVRKIIITDRQANQEVNQGYGYWRSARYISTRLVGYKLVSASNCQGLYSMFKVDIDKIKELAKKNICHLPSVQELCIESWDPVRSYSRGCRFSHSVYVRHLLTESLLGLGNTLKKLTLSGHPQGFQTFLGQLPESVQFPALRDLRLVLTSRSTLDEEPLMDSLLPFVNSLSAQLEQLHIVYDEKCVLDLSPFFASLGKFSALKSFTLHAPFNEAFDSDLSGSSLTRFFENHTRTLRNVGLILDSPHWAYIAGFNAEQEPLRQWLVDNLRSNWMMYSNIQELEISSVPSADVFEALIDYLRKSSGSMTSLSIRNIHLSLNDTDRLLTVLLENVKAGDKSLSELSFGIKLLSAGMMDLLAKKLMWLPKLRLDIEWIGRERASITIEDRLRDLFCRDMKMRRYPEWQLRELEITSRRAADASQPVVSVLKDCVAGNAVINIKTPSSDAAIVV